MGPEGVKLPPSLPFQRKSKRGNENFSCVISKGTVPENLRVMDPLSLVAGKKRQTGHRQALGALQLELGSQSCPPSAGPHPSLPSEVSSTKGNSFCAPNEEGRSSPTSTEIPYDEQRQVPSLPSVPTGFRFKSMS